MRRIIPTGRAWRSSPGDADAAFARRIHPRWRTLSGWVEDRVPDEAAPVRETILLVEDEPAVRRLFAQALSRAGYRVYEARNGPEAMKVFDQHANLPNFHLFLLHVRSKLVKI